MSADIRNDAPAFPCELEVPISGGFRLTRFPGLSGRAYVAARCLQGMLACSEFRPARDAGEPMASAYARAAVDYADALLARLAEPCGKEGAQ